MLIRDEILTTSGFLETISGGRKHFRLTDNSRKHVEDLKHFKNVDSRRRCNYIRFGVINIREVVNGNMYTQLTSVYEAVIR